MGVPTGRLRVVALGVGVLALRGAAIAFGVCAVAGSNGFLFLGVRPLVSLGKATVALGVRIGP